MIIWPHSVLQLSTPNEPMIQTVGLEMQIARQYEHSQMRLVREDEDLHPETPKCFCKSQHTRQVSDCV